MTQAPKISRFANISRFTNWTEITPMAILEFLFNISRFAIWPKNCPSAILEFFNSLTFLDFQSEQTHFHGISRKLKHFSTFSSSREEIHELEVNLDTLLSFYCGNLFKVPKPRYPSDANSKRQRKFELFKPSLVQLEEQLEQHRQGAGVQPYPVIT